MYVFKTPRVHVLAEEGDGGKGQGLQTPGHPWIAQPMLLGTLAASTPSSFSLTFTVLLRRLMSSIRAFLHSSPAPNTMEEG